MKKFVMPALILLAGSASLIAPLFAVAECGVNPQTIVPSKCKSPYEAQANVPSSSCYFLSDGTCLSTSCGGIVWSNGVPGRCEGAIITENNVPQCLSSFAVTNVTIHQYSMSCTYGGHSMCTCQLTSTGVSDLVPVCNCKDLEPVHF